MLARVWEEIGEIEGLTIHSPKTMLVTEPRSERFDHFKSLWKGSAKLFYARVALD